MELRDIEIFLALAEELHFGRTADRLHVSQARVSQSIAKQERQIGAPLFARSSRRVELTAIGIQLRDDLSAGYQRILDGTRAAAATARTIAAGTTRVWRVAVRRRASPEGIREKFARKPRRRLPDRPARPPRRRCADAPGGTVQKERH